VQPFFRAPLTPRFRASPQPHRHMFHAPGPLFFPP
jgi:hypothetical protein